MTDVITKPITKQTAKQTAKPLAKPLIALACAHEVHELCRLVSCECGCHGSHD